MYEIMAIVADPGEVVEALEISPDTGPMVGDGALPHVAAFAPSVGPHGGGAT